MKTISAIVLMMALLAQAASGQETPPTQSLELWLDAKSLSLTPTDSSTEGVASWSDKSGKNRHAVAVDPRYQPNLIAADGASIVRFDGNDDFLSVDGMPPMEALTVAMVVRPRSNTGEFRGFLSGNARGQNDYVSGLNIDLGPFGTADWNWLNVEAAGTIGAVNLLDQPMPFNQFQMLVVSMDRQSGCTLHLNGKQVGHRPWNGARISLEPLLIGARIFRNEPGPPYPRGFIDADFAELVVYSRRLGETDRAAIEAYLASRHAELLRSKSSEKMDPLTMVLPGYETHRLPLDVTNINDLAYDSQGRLWLLGYDGRVHIAFDSNGDHLEDKLATYWDRPTIRGPLAIVLRPDGVYVSSIGKVSRLIDDNGDDRADREEIVVSGWTSTDNLSGGVDALGMAFDKDGVLYLGLGCADFTNAYRIKNDQSHYSLESDRGTILRIGPEGKRAIIATGIRFPVAMAFNAKGDLFATDQEGETWLPGGNPLDELLHIQPKRHYGFPPRHERHLPDVLDEPAIALYGPQHQSTCGLTFNESRDGQKAFGPKIWEGDAIVSGYSRGKIWRTKLASSDAGYVTDTQLIASCRQLVVDAIVSPKGALVVSGHSGQPDWGSGPSGKGTLYKIARKEALPTPVAIWAASPIEVRIAFDQPLEGEWTATIEHGPFVEAGDRFEVLRPGYESVRRQQLSPRRELAVRAVRMSADRRTMFLTTDPHASGDRYAVTLSRSSAGPPMTMDLAYGLGGVEMRAGDSKTRMWRPHFDTHVCRQLLAGMANRNDEDLRGAAVTLRTHVRPWMEKGKLVLRSTRTMSAAVNGEKVTVERTPEDVWIANIELSQPADLEVHFAASDMPLDLAAHFLPDRDPVPRPVPRDAFVLPWAADRSASTEEIPLPPPPELAGGDWKRGEGIFYSQAAQCGNCHQVRGKGKNIGPDLSNLIHRDVASVTRDIVEPNAAINPDYTPLVVLLTSGESFSGLVRPSGEGRVTLIDATSKEHQFSTDEIEEFQPSRESIMPKGLVEKIGEQGMRDLLVFLTQAPSKPPESAGGLEPTTRSRAEVDRVLAEVPFDKSQARPMNIVLVAGPKDHGPGEHDYPAWQTRWKALLSSEKGVRVSNAFGWPEPVHFELADVMIFYLWCHDWSPERFAQLDKYFARGGGLVTIHAGTIADKEPLELAKRIGLAFQPGATKFRHGALTLAFASTADPILAGITKLDLVDETYWPMVGEVSRVEVLATAVEEGKPWPMIWKYEPKGGRVFASIMGHYSWTFDDPIMRAVLLRGISWAAGQEEGRLQHLATDGVELK